MENGFGLKDLFLCLLVTSVGVLVVLAMHQYDRQWETMRETNRLLTSQTTDLSHIRRLLEQQLAMGPMSTTRTSSTSDVSPDAGFERVIAAHAAPDYAQGGQLRQIVQAIVPKITPLISNDQGAQDIWGAVMDSLVIQDPDTLVWQPSLAQSWKISDDSLTIDFNLRRGITFSDGAPFTADDVVFTFKFMLDPAVEDPAMKVGADRLKDITKIDDYNVRFVFKEPYFGSFSVAGGMPIMSKAFYSKYSATEFNQSTGLLIGTGPYRLPDPTSWRPTPGQPLVLLRNERYWGPTPSFDRIVLDVIEEPAARVTAFRNGDIDFFGGEDGPPTPEQYDQMCADKSLTARTNHWEFDTPIEGFYYLGWNEKQGRDGKPSAFADARVRRAMTMLTDRAAIIQSIIHGHGSPITGIFPPQTPASDPSIQPWPFDPAAAEKLLAEAGFHRDADRLIGPDGKPLSFKILFNSNSEPRRRIASFLHDAYAKMGIDCQPESAEWSVFRQRMDERQYDVIIGAWGGTIEGDPYGEFDSSQIAGTADNFVQYSNPACDAAINAARSTVDQAKRMPLWHKFDQIIHQDQPYTFLFIYKQLNFAQNRLHGLSATKALGINSSAEWYIPQALQVSQ